MKSLFSKTKAELKNSSGLITAEEIFQQPDVWEKTFALINQQKEEISDFLNSILDIEKLRIIFAGAGTSGYIGDILVPYLKKIMPETDIESVHTTEIVSHPKVYLAENIPTLLFSYARSGNSPESLATVELAEKIIDDLYQIIITCNKDGSLAKNAGGEKTKVILLPEETHDRGFAMTSSFTSMLLAALLVFDIECLNSIKKDIDLIIDNARSMLQDTRVIESLAALDFKKIVYLGSYSYFGIAKEATLKLLELTAGKIVSRYDTPLGFRHGPKSIIDDQTLVVLFLSRDQYSQKYDYDLLKELALQKGNFKTLVLAEEYDQKIDDIADNLIILAAKTEAIDEIYNSLNYITAPQILAMLNSLKIGITPDDPSPSGEVNRVVQGVKIYPYQ
ncbi:SIS domain-containing protein [Halanaerobium praevalens]|uniref:Sugar isomerase (SIS) n=1 Tax=Halanaerobium praevalens (strain ATCC 33744 / DSM 2228 / GSL) TaxID=572479 RepID=E3DNI5_HALPG|nr:SIS domain-containing protein [Halanaerobium praevalens]ADO76523.1 sugar isomerase (SIS) [Halanaerobium praevalens DSM 2228]